jgi:V/A-type H+/Na+-transporting ATPase subunit D
MARINVPPTRSSLLRLREELKSAREGHKVLDRKREALVAELIRMVRKAETLQEEMNVLEAKAYKALQRAKLVMGEERVEWASLAINKTVDVQLKFHGVMGVSIPRVESRGEPPKMPYSLGDTTAALDEASATFREVLNRIPELAELITSVWRLAVELRKTQRRVNALQYIFIPEYEDTISFIVSTLEEREREETFYLKRLKAKATDEVYDPQVHEFGMLYRELYDKPDTDNS